MFNQKPIIGLTGGIGGGKSFVADLFGQEGCGVIHSDELVTQVYQDPQARTQLESWWGRNLWNSQGQLDRAALADKIFADPEQRQKLQDFLYPRVGGLRTRLMQQWSSNAQIQAFVWDTPLLFETGLNRDCDAVVFVDAPKALRLERLAHDRRWNEPELDRRENLQWPLDRKREISDYVIDNTADAAYARGQVRQVLSRILARLLPDNA